MAHPNATPEPKGTTIIKFVMKDDPEQTLDVVKENLTKHGLKVLQKRGYVQASKLLQEQAKAAAEKEVPEEEPVETEEAPKTPGRPRRS